MRVLELREHREAQGVRLAPEELAELRRALPSVAVSPSRAPGRWDLRPGSTVGSVRAGMLRVVIRPKLPIDRLLFLLGYASSPRHWRELQSVFDPRADLVDVIAALFLRLLRPVARTGLLQGYVTRDEALAGLRGRLRVEDQLRRWCGRFPPVEAHYDDFTPDILENQLLAAAAQRLRSLPLRREATGKGLRALDRAFASVTPRLFDPRRVPAVRWTRLNRHYRPAISLARRILESTSFELGAGGVEASGLLIDMNRLFEDFVAAALRESLGATARTFPQGARGRRLDLDRAGRLPLAPDLSWWRAGRCVFVGDVKYKLDRGSGHRADLYQLLAYVLAADLPSGLLIYADLDGPGASHRVRHADRLLEIAGLDFTRPPDRLLGQVASLASRIRRCAERTTWREDFLVPRTTLSGNRIGRGTDMSAEATTMRRETSCR